MPRASRNTEINTFLLLFYFILHYIYIYLYIYLFRKRINLCLDIAASMGIDRDLIKDRLTNITNVNAIPLVDPVLEPLLTCIMHGVAIHHGEM
jgi:hypothetical protein